MKPGRFLTAAMVVFALIVVPMAAYVGGYYGLQVDTLTSPGTVMHQMNDTRVIQRFYRHRWQADAFTPAGRVESWLTGNDVEVVCISDVE
jgi:hypothetical protein